MEKLQCKTCGSFSMIPMDVELVDEEQQDELLSNLGLEEREGRFYNCHVCGDNWLSIKEVNPDGNCRITFIHHMGSSPLLRRVAQMDTHIVLGENTVAAWDYFFDDDPVDETEWRDQLQERRTFLKAACCN